MISRLSIRNFQSLKQVDLDLGVFTVIVGPSSSGKSALLRAVRALAQNVRGSNVITRGQKVMAITAQTENHTITLERDARQGVYRLREPGVEQQQFTKLGGEVPPQVADALRIDPGKDSVNFASQFDAPYLLDESGSQVARQLGELTNVTRILEAVARANRNRTQAASRLKNRRSDLDDVRTRLKDFHGLSDRLSALEKVEQLDVSRKAITATAQRLTSALQQARQAAEQLSAVVPAPVPDASELREQYRRWLDLTSRLAAISAARVQLEAAEQAVWERATDLGAARAELATGLRKAKVCPTCGQRTC